MILINPIAGDDRLSIHRTADHILVLLRCVVLMSGDLQPRVLNLDCGEGRLARACGELAFGAWTGVDKSLEALEAARLTRCFTDLVLRSADDFLAADPSRYSVVVCSQGLSLWSGLTGLFAAVAKHLLPGGTFVFSTEELPPGPSQWRLGARNRHAHTVAYLEACAASAGFIVPTTYRALLETDNARPVMSRITMLQRIGAAG